MTRLLAELDRLDHLGRPDAVDRWNTHNRPRRRRDRGRSAHPARALARTLTASVLAATLTATVVLMFAYKQYGVTISSDGLHVPHRLGRPPVVAAGLGTFRFMRTQPGSTDPVTYDPCRPVEYVVNPALASPGWQQLLDGAIAEVSGATGLVFVSAGRTDQLPDAEAGRARREPVLIAWTTPSVVPRLGGRVAGIGGSTAVEDSYTGRLRYVTGTVALDAADLAGVLARPGGDAEARAIIMHELGHVVGLAHVGDRHELMYADNVGQLSFGPGDREGLAALGGGRCFF